MLVGDRMSKPVLSVSPETQVQDALAQMRKENVSRYPVLNKKGKLVGIVSESDLLNASPSEATTLSVWEINYLLSKITVERVMSKNVITVEEDCTLEEAARLMADHRIGGLPVIRNDSVVGIITETDLFRLFLEMMGGRESGIRVSVLIKEQPGMLHRLTKAIDEAGGNIIAVSTFAGESTEDREVTLKVSQMDVAVLQKALDSVVEKICDLREIKIR
ncbi:MAG: CBS domain-containing protein [Anaerolineaceae bacterium]|nr:CBS domain-containing protein [Anaerolineaceae bacterium]